KVLKASTAITAYASKANNNLFVTIRSLAKTLGISAAGSRSSQRAGTHSHPQDASIWCTGKDSNLRTSQGGADLQSAGFNHSPTCAISGEHRAASVEQSLLSLVAHRSQLKAFSDTPLQSIRITHCHGDQKVRVEKIRAN